MGCMLDAWKERAARNNWSTDEIIIATGGVCACNYHKVFHTVKGNIPFPTKENEHEVKIAFEEIHISIGDRHPSNPE